jgi:hypothetical protein
MEKSSHLNAHSHSGTKEIPSRLCSTVCSSEPLTVISTFVTLRYILILSFQLNLVSQIVSCHQDFNKNNVYISHFSRLCKPRTFLVPPVFNDLTTPLTFGEQDRLQNSSLRCFISRPVLFSVRSKYSPLSRQRSRENEVQQCPFCGHDCSHHV